MLVTLHQQNPQMRWIKKAAEILQQGGVIVYPTDTVYGLGCDLFNKKGIERIYDIKKRDRKQPLSFICADLKDISQYAQVSDFAYKVMKRLLPGPYTFVLKASRLVPKAIIPKRQTTGIRVPDNRICMALVLELGRPIISTSVKDDDGEVMTDPEAIEKKFHHVVDIVLDGGISSATPSSVLSLVDDVVEIIRIGKGDVTAFQ
ncbi:MAG: threonylcarbamoyl-AMP synthase [Syntrophaceae bacterium]|nr:threonylcarbamoyl-AMP synthase [Syntrophaceae bacterium]